MTTRLIFAPALILPTILSAQSDPFEQDALRCERVWNSTVWVRLSDKSVNGKQVLLVSSQRAGKPFDEHLGRVLTLEGRRPQTMLFQDFDPLVVTLGVDYRHYTDPVFSDIVEVLGKLSQQQKGLVPTEDSSQASVVTISKLLDVDRAFHGSASSDNNLKPLEGKLLALVQKDLGSGSVGRERVQKEIEACKKRAGLIADKTKLNDTVLEIRKFYQSRQPDCSPELQMTEAKSQSEENSTCAFYRALAEYLQAFDRPEVWCDEDRRGGSGATSADYILAKTDQTPQQAIVLDFKYRLLSDPSSTIQEKPLGVRFPYFWNRASFDLSAGVAYRTLSEAEQTLVQRGSTTTQSSQSSVNWSAAAFGNLTFRIGGSWMHPMLQIGVGQDKTNLLKFYGLGLRLSEPLPVSFTWGISRSGSSKDHYVAIGYHFH